MLSSCSHLHLGDLQSNTILVSENQLGELVRKKLFEILNAFQDPSGLEVNKTKTEGMWLGALRHNSEAHLDISWPY